ncbi:MAG: hypothetical protein KKB13_06980 [Chloroflexi bacterium]|nr:hypothetical protein [Chloroflexota bacterium]MBU1879772.1 hypothetical protein [Chloroflexota bacterium]
MNQRTRAYLFIVGVWLLTILACTVPGMPSAQATKPQVQIVSPTSGAQFKVGDIVAVQATATDAAGVSLVELLVNQAVVDTQSYATPQPAVVAMLRWATASAGGYVLAVRAYNAAGTASDPAMVGVDVAASPGDTGVTPMVVPPTNVPPPTANLPPPTQVPPPTAPPPPGNRAPVINSLTANPQTVPAGGSAALVIDAYDPDGDPLTTSWDIQGGKGTLIGATTYIAPIEPSQIGPVTITAIVSDDKGTVATKSVVVTVVRPGGVYDAGPAFQSTWGSDPALQDRLGWAVEAQRDLPPQGADYQAAEQPFERGRMFWYGDVRLIYSLYTNDYRWQAFDDTFSWADPAPTVLPDVGCTAPMQGGFRKVWWNEPNVRARIGCPTQGEQGAVGTIQRFQHGVMIQSGLGGRVFALFDDGTWQ